MQSSMGIINYENEKIALKYALNINIEKLLKFELYRKKDNRMFRFIVYDGKNYDCLCDYLQFNNENVGIPQESKLQIGAMYNINGKHQFIQVDRSMLTYILGMNSYIIIGKHVCFQAFNHDIAKWLITKYKGIYLQNLPEINHSGNAKKYCSLEDLENVLEDSCYRTDKVWLLPCQFRNDDIDIDSIPEEALDSYRRANDGYQEFKVFEHGGKKGLKLYGFDDKVLLEPEFREIITDNYRAFVKNEEGLWAEYNSKSHAFKSDFIYTDVEVDSEQGFAAACINGKRVVLHSAWQSVKQQIVNHGGFFGIESSEKTLLDCIYDSISCFGNGYEVFKEGKYGLVDNQCRFILDCEYDNIIVKSPFSPIFQACKNGLWGIVGKNIVYAEFCDEKPDDEKYEAAVDTYINQAYERHRLLKTSIKFIDKESGVIHMQIVDFGKDFRIKRHQLPEDIYRQVLSGYVLAVQTLGKSALRVNANGNIEYSYEKTARWLAYRRNFNQLNVGDIYEGTVSKMTAAGAIVKLENEVYGKMKCNNQTLHIGNAITCRVIRKTRESIYLEEFADRSK